MKRNILITLLIASIFLTTVFFAGGNPPSLRGFYYVLWLSFFYFVFWRRQDRWQQKLGSIALSQPTLFISLGVLMILIEETFAAITVNILHVPSLGALLATVPQYYANNLLLLPGFVVAWYFLLKRYAFTRGEVFVLAGLFGLFAEKIYAHILSIPILGIPLVLPTMFTYFAILFPSLLSLQPGNQKSLNRFGKYLFGFMFPILVSLPFLLVHALLSKIGLIDPTVLQK